VNQFMPTRYAWNDNNYEGKALRRVFTKLLKRFEKDIADDNVDIDKLQKIAHTLSLVAREKVGMRKKGVDLIPMMNRCLRADGTEPFSTITVSHSHKNNSLEVCF